MTGKKEVKETEEDLFVLSKDKSRAVILNRIKAHVTSATVMKTFRIPMMKRRITDSRQLRTPPVDTLRDDRSKKRKFGIKRSEKVNKTQLKTSFVQQLSRSGSLKLYAKALKLPSEVFSRQKHGTQIIMVASRMVKKVTELRKEYNSYLGWKGACLLSLCRQLCAKISEQKSPNPELTDQLTLSGSQYHVAGYKAFFPQHSYHSSTPYDFDAWDKQQDAEHSASLPSMSGLTSLDSFDMGEGVQLSGGATDKYRQSARVNGNVGADKSKKRCPKNNDDDVIPVPYPCTDDCIVPTEEEIKRLKELVTGFADITPSTIRSAIATLTNCSNCIVDSPYQLNVERRNHPEVCFRNSPEKCSSGEVLLRKAAIHCEVPRKLLKLVAAVKHAHLFLSDLDAATYLRDMDYILKLIDLKVPKSPTINNVDTSVARQWTVEMIEKTFAEGIAQFKKDLQDNLPRHPCSCCSKFVKKKAIQIVKDSWKHSANKAFLELKKYLDVGDWDKHKIPICNTCYATLCKNKIPASALMNSMDTGEVPDIIKACNPFELNLLRRAKAYATIFKLGTSGGHLPYKYRANAMKGSVFYLPVPLEKTLETLKEDRLDSKSCNPFIFVFGVPKKNREVWKSLIDVKRVHSALTWLVANNPEYEGISVPEDPEDIVRLDDDDDSAADDQDAGSADEERIIGSGRSDESLQDLHINPSATLKGGACPTQQALDMAADICCDLTICRPCKKRVRSVYKVLGRQPWSPSYTSKVDKRSLKMIRKKKTEDILADLQTFKAIKSHKLVTFGDVRRSNWLIKKFDCSSCKAHVRSVAISSHIAESHEQCSSAVADKHEQCLHLLNEIAVASDRTCQRCYGEVKRISSYFGDIDLTALEQKTPVELSKMWFIAHISEDYLKRCLAQKNRQPIPCTKELCSVFPSFKKDRALLSIKGLAKTLMTSPDPNIGAPNRHCHVPTSIPNQQASASSLLHLLSEAAPSLNQAESFLTPSSEPEPSTSPKVNPILTPSPTPNCTFPTPKQPSPDPAKTCPPQHQISSSSTPVYNKPGFIQKLKLAKSSLLSLFGGARDSDSSNDSPQLPTRKKSRRCVSSESESSVCLMDTDQEASATLTPTPVLNFNPVSPVISSVDTDKAASNTLTPPPGTPPPNPSPLKNSQPEDKSQSEGEDKGYDDSDAKKDPAPESEESALRKLTEHDKVNLLQHKILMGDTERQMESIVDGLYQEVRTDRKCLDNRKVLNLDVLSNPDVFPFGRGGRNAPRKTKIQPSMYEKARLLSSNGTARRNMSYLFQLMQNNENRRIHDGVYDVLSNARSFSGMTAGKLLGMMKSKNKGIERNLTRVLNKVQNTPQYWRGPLSRLNAKVNTIGPASIFSTYSPIEYEYDDLHQYLLECNADLPGVEELSASELIARDPVLTSIYIHTRFEALLNFIRTSHPLGEVTDYWVRTEYQGRGPPHFHCLFWLKDGPVIGRSDDQTVLDFINTHISVKRPDKTLEGEMSTLVERGQIHKCQKYCQRRVKSKNGKWRRIKCRFGFPKPVMERSQLHDVVSSIIGRRTLNSKKTLYDLVRTKRETNVNPYNPILLYLWEGNMDIQLVSEDTYSIIEYVCKYISKPEKSNAETFEWPDIDGDKDLISNLWSFARTALKSRDIGAYEAADRFFMKDLYQTSRQFQFLPANQPKYRSRPLKSKAELAKDPNSTDVYKNDFIHVFYPQRPDELEEMSFYDFGAKYTRTKVGQGKPFTAPGDNDGGSGGDEPFAESGAEETDVEEPVAVEEGLPPIITLKNGLVMYRRKKDAIVYYPEHDPKIKEEAFYYSMLSLFTPWRTEADILHGKTTYFDAFTVAAKGDSELISTVEKIKHLKLVRESTRKKVAEGLGKEKPVVGDEDHADEYEPGEDYVTDTLNDFETVNSNDDIKTQEELDQLIAMIMINVEQRRVFDKVTHAIRHQADHRSGACICKEERKPYFFISGQGGTGKSFIIRALMAWSHLHSKVLKTFENDIGLAAPTGLAACNICGQTCHGLLHIPVEHGDVPKFRPLSDSVLTQLRAVMKNMSTLIVDEISMVANSNTLYIHMRLQEIFKGTPGGDDWFGGRVVVFFGDLCQLPPVNAEPPYQELSGEIVNKITGSLPIKCELWRKLFSFEELTINQRQTGTDNEVWRSLLTRLRVGALTNNDVARLAKRIIPYSLSSYSEMTDVINYYALLRESGKEPVCLLPTKNMVDEFNSAVASRLNLKVIKIPAKDEFVCKIKNAEGNAKTRLKKLDSDSRNTGGLVSVLELAIGSKVMLRRNISIREKLVNGSMGVVSHFTHDVKGAVTQINVLFDGSKKPVPVEVSTAKILLFPQAYVYRRQFPLCPAFAMTIHKCQGLSLDCVMADVGKKVFDGGQTYVALSRCKTIQGLHLINFDARAAKPPKGALEEYWRLSHKLQYKRKPSLRNLDTTEEVVWYNTRIKETVKATLNDDIRASLPRPKKKRPSYKTTNPPQANKKPSTTGKKKPAKPRKSANPTPMANQGELQAVQRTLFTYFRVNNQWREERAAQLGFDTRQLPLIREDQALIDVDRTSRPDPNKTIRVDGDGNCFFRSISWYITGDEGNHERVRALMMTHVENNPDIFRAFAFGNTGDSLARLTAWCADKALTQARPDRQRFSNDDGFPSHWADTNCVAVVASLLKTPIFSFAPTRGTRAFKWVDVGPTLFAAAEDFPGVTYTESDRAIFLDNRARHFQPTGLS